ncbi:hypothetical protein A4X13_0g9561 [Tilletia indica]|uniref:Uncharacterized protein n=1 Tax=Tilletia indica TaxID=43049 RepID=A0A8T8S8W8_9BASI|nr:hypothetical protein A4X13_0g9561 [Tilletia indica]
MRPEQRQQVAQPQAPIGGMQQQGAQLLMLVVGQHHVQVVHGGLGDQLRQRLLIECQQFVDTAGGAQGECVVGRQRRLDVEVDQQDPPTGVGDKAAQVGGNGRFADPAFGRNYGDYVHDPLPVRGGAVSNALFEAFGDPAVDFDGVPTDGANPQAQGPGELAFLHQVVDVGTLEAGLGFNFRAAQDAMLGNRGLLSGHSGHSFMLGSTRKG